MFTRFYLAILIIITPMLAQGQSYTIRKIKDQSKEVLAKLTNKDIAAAAAYDVNSYYSYITQNGDTTWGMLKDDKKTQGKILNVYTLYNLHYVYPKCSVYSTINCNITLELDDKLKLNSQPDLSYIPDYMLKNEACHLMTSAEAIKIAKEKYFIPCKVEPNAHFWYDHKSKVFTWSVDGVYIKDSTKRNEYSTQIVTLDASTGALISQAKF